MNRNRTRKWLQPSTLGQYWTRGGSSATSEISDSRGYHYYFPITTIESCTDTQRSRKDYKEFRRTQRQGLRRNVGGPLTVAKRVVKVFPASCDIIRGYKNPVEVGVNSAQSGYSGGIIPLDFIGGDPTYTPPLPPPDAFTLPENTYFDMTRIGTEGWAKYSPTTPKASLSQFLGELHQLPRNPLSLMRQARSFHKGAADSYLNWEFGWKPFINDLRQLLIAYLDFDRRLQQLTRDNGKPVRRKGIIDSEKRELIESIKITGQPGQFSFPTQVYYHYSDMGDTYARTRERVTKSWFSGSFVYYLQPYGSIKYYEQINRIIYGLDLTPKLVWELTPWSWLSDWYTNVGDLLQNYVNIQLDSLVADYAYAMASIDIRTTVTVETFLKARLPYLTGADGDTAASRFVCQGVIHDSLRLREKAHPYGFGIQNGDLTQRQLAILTALGFSKVKL